MQRVDHGAHFNHRLFKCQVLELQIVVLDSDLFQLDLKLLSISHPRLVSTLVLYLLFDPVHVKFLILRELSDLLSSNLARCLLEQETGIDANSVRLIDWADRDLHLDEAIGEWSTC